MTQSQQQQGSKSNWKASRAGTYKGQQISKGQNVQMTDDEAETANRDASSNPSAAQFERA